METTISIVMKLVRSEIDKKYTLPWQSITIEEAKDAYEIGKQHGLSHLVAAAIVHNRLVTDNQFFSEMYEAMYTAIMRHEVLEKELKSICAVFEKNGVYHIPLKGAVAWSYYPQAWMRSCQDLDILVKPEECERACELLKKEMGCTQTVDSMHDKGMRTRKGICIEVHHRFVADENLTEAENMLNNIWDSVSKVSAREYQMGMTSEVFLYYHLLHMAKHYMFGGFEIKSVLDWWILKNKMDYNSDELSNMLKKGGLERFHESLNELCEVWFLDRKPTKEILDIQEYLVTGAYQSYDTMYKMRGILDKKGKAGVFLSKIFLTSEQLKTQYPIVEKYPVLGIFCQIHRWGGLLFGKRRESTKTVLKMLKETPGHQVKLLGNALKALGLEKEGRDNDDRELAKKGKG